jgi:cytochrome d ubiquinol oxidase subunit II
MNTLQVIWFLLIGFLLTGYALLDGFDLGVGFWHLFAKGDKNRRRMLNAIGPVWDGNEVWILTGAGAIFAAFPPVYASVFSGFYLALMLVLLGLIMRAVSIEFRGQVQSEKWRASWDIAFSVGSTLPALLFGVALGNIMRGVPLDANGDFTGSFFSLLNPYSLIIGITGLAMIATHGAVFTQLKTTGSLEESAKKWTSAASIAYLAFFIIATIATFAFHSYLRANIWKMPLLGILPLMTLVSIVGIGFFNKKCEPKKAFIASSISIIGMMGIVGASIFPNMVRASNDPALSLTIYNSSSSKITLTVMLILTGIGMPIVIGYTIYIYKLFKGKVDLDEGIY